MEIPSIGRIVHYTTRRGECRAAMVSRVLTDGVVDLHVFVGRGDVAEFLQVGVVVVASIPYGGEPSAAPSWPPMSWHWPERVVSIQEVKAPQDHGPRGDDGL